jgi:hypothetical protein
MFNWDWAVIPKLKSLENSAGRQMGKGRATCWPFEMRHTAQPFAPHPSPGRIRPVS